MARIGLSIMLGALMLACAPTVRYVNRGVSYQIRSDVKPVGDVEGHFAGSWVNRGLCLENVGLKDEEVGVMSSWGTFDAVYASPTQTNSCKMTGKTTCTYEDRSTRTDEWTADCKPGPGGLLISEGRGVYVGGTGRFEGIKGSISWTSRTLTPEPHFLSYTTVGTNEYTLPKK